MFYSEENYVCFFVVFHHFDVYFFFLCLQKVFFGITYRSKKLDFVRKVIMIRSKKIVETLFPNSKLKWNYYDTKNALFLKSVIQFIQNQKLVYNENESTLN